MRTNGTAVARKRFGFDNSRDRINSVPASNTSHAGGSNFSPLRSRRFLSIIVPVYNVAQTLAEQLDALKAQVYAGDWEIIVVDNGSTDDSAAVVQAYMSHMPNLRMIRATAKQSCAYARNAGAAVAKGDAFIFCDGDDMVAPGWLAALAAALEQHDFVAGTLETAVINEGNVWCPSPPNWATQTCLDFMPFAGGALTGVTKEAFEKVGGFVEDIRVADDIDFSWRLQLNGYQLHHVPGATVQVRFRSTWQDLWRQTAAFAEGHVWLFKQFAAYGMPRSSGRTVLRTYRWLLSNLVRWPRLPQETKMRLLRVAASRWGRLKGSLRYQTLYL